MSDHAIVPRSTSLTLEPTQTEWTAQQRAAIEQLVGSKSAPKLRPADLSIFFHQCQRTGMDPFARQIYLVERKGKFTIQTGIDGYRLIAERTGAYVGNDERTEGVTPDGYPAVAIATVRKLVGGQVFEFTARAHWAEYAVYYGDRLGNMWAKMPHTMLSKCAEAKALRKAFPQDLSGIYTAEEMDQADNTIVLATTEQQELIRELADQLGLDDDGLRKGLVAHAGVSTAAVLSHQQAAHVIDKMTEAAARKQAAEVVEDTAHELDTPTEDAAVVSDTPTTTKTPQEVAA